MNPRTLALLVVVALASGATGWFLHTPPAPEKTPEAPIASTAKTVTPTVDAPKAAPAAPTQVATPKSAPTAVSGTSAAPTPAAADPGVATPQPVPPELVTSIAEITAVVRAGDFTSLIENYMPPEQLSRMTPEQKTYFETQISQQMQTPQGQKSMQAMTQMYESLAGLTPNITADGSHATFQVPTPKGIAPEGANLPPTLPITFVKQNGRWYVNSGL